MVAAAAAAAGAAHSRNYEATRSPASRTARGRRSPGGPPSVVLTPAASPPGSPAGERSAPSGPRRVRPYPGSGLDFRLGHHRTAGTRPQLLDGSLCWASDEKQERKTNRLIVKYSLTAFRVYYLTKVDQAVKLTLQPSGKSTGVSDNCRDSKTLVVSVGDQGTAPANLTELSYLHPSGKNGEISNRS